jgi:hypothetical protein
MQFIFKDVIIGKFRYIIQGNLQGSLSEAFLPFKLKNHHQDGEQGEYDG